MEAIFFASSPRLVLLISEACMRIFDWRSMASITLGWDRPTLLTPTPAETSIYRLPSGSFTVTPLPTSNTSGKPPPPRVIDSNSGASASSSAAFGPGTPSVIIFGASAKESSASSCSDIIYFPLFWFNADQVLTTCHAVCSVFFPVKDALIKSIQDLSEHAKQKM